MIARWADQGQADFAALPDNAIAVLPLGATEQHGPHLPFGVDTILTEAVLDRVEASAPVLQLPTLTITKSDEHHRHAGTLGLGAATLLAMLDDITASLARTKVRRLVFFNGHGGNTALLEVAARAARIDHNMICASTSWFAFADQSLFDADAVAYDLHAGDLETSAMLAAQPDLVDMNRAQNFRSAMQDWEQAGHQTGLTGQPARPGWIIDDLNPEGALGNAAAATVEKGTQLLDSAAQGFAAWLEDFALFDHRATT
ncbi:creatininase family protein [uncultured Tateyamaria sp.]|uniref:creatininase family protein n=1 Tax=uncultured Tateyamaria sp. TaxID=455651 RepID=UPI002631B76E|nr:creatininase family protein [uncultured Tateyamaria sp.]